MGLVNAARNRRLQLLDFAAIDPMSAALAFAQISPKSLSYHLVDWRPARSLWRSHGGRQPHPRW